jgi:hypothetical protein
MEKKINHITEDELKNNVICKYVVNEFHHLLDITNEKENFILFMDLLDKEMHGKIDWVFYRLKGNSDKSNSANYTIYPEFLNEGDHKPFLVLLLCLLDGYKISVGATLYLLQMIKTMGHVNYLINSLKILSDKYSIENGYYKTEITMSYLAVLFNNKFGQPSKRYYNELHELKKKLNNP